MANIRVEGLRSLADVTFCRCEVEVPERGYAVVNPTAAEGMTKASADEAGITNAVLPAGEAEGGFSPEWCQEWYCDGEFLGDVRTLENTRVVYAPVPPVE